MTFRIGSLFSGYGGLDMGVQATIGGAIAWHCDNDVSASRILAHHWPGIPNLGDITAVDWRNVEPIDILTGGSPCQDVSSAGKQAGMRAGTRSGLWSSMCDAIGILKPRLVVWENVRGVLSADADSDMESCPICMGDTRESHLRAFGRVVGDLASLGYDAQWAGVRASDVGAPHERFRVFLCARPSSTIPLSVGRDGRPWAFRAPEWDESAHAGDLAANAGCDTWARNIPDRSAPGWRGETPAERLIGGPDASISGGIGWGEYGSAIRRWEGVLGRSAPSPTCLGRSGKPRLNPVFTEWMMGLSPGHVTGVPGLSMNEQSKVLGNGVVPRQAEFAVSRILRGAPS